MKSHQWDKLKIAFRHNNSKTSSLTGTHLDEPLSQQINSLSHGRVIFREKLDDMFWRATCLKIPAETTWLLINKCLFNKTYITFTWECRHLRFEGAEDSRLHDVIPAGEFLQASFLDFPIIFSFTVTILLKYTVMQMLLKWFIYLGNNK